MLFLFTVVYSQLGLSRVLGSIYCSRWVRDRNPLWTTAHTLTWMQFRGHASQTCIASLLSSQVSIYTQACVYVCACTSISSSVNGVLLKNVTVRFFFLVAWVNYITSWLIPDSGTALVCKVEATVTWWGGSVRLSGCPTITQECHSHCSL